MSDIKQIIDLRNKLQEIEKRQVLTESTVVAEGPLGAVVKGGKNLLKNFKGGATNPANKARTSQGTFAPNRSAPGVANTAGKTVAANPGKTAAAAGVAGLATGAAVTNAVKGSGADQGQAAQTAPAKPVAQGGLTAAELKELEMLYKEFKKFEKDEKVAPLIQQYEAGDKQPAQTGQAAQPAQPAKPVKSNTPTQKAADDEVAQVTKNAGVAPAGTTVSDQSSSSNTTRDGNSTTTTTNSSAVIKGLDMNAARQTPEYKEILNKQFGNNRMMKVQAADMTYKNEIAKGNIRPPAPPANPIADRNKNADF